MVNYDIPWNPVRLEQRMGRIHRYGQEKDCLIFNFVTTNTREGRVLQKLFERIGNIENDLDPNRTGKVFNVLGDVFPGNQLEKMLRDMYAHNNMTEELIKQRIVEEVDTERFKGITNSTLEGLGETRTEPFCDSRQIGGGARAAPGAGGDPGFLRSGGSDCRSHHDGAPAWPECVSDRSGAAPPVADRRTVGASVWATGSRIQTGGFRQREAENGGDGGMGNAGTPAV